MSHLVSAAQLYGRVALLRRRLVLQHTVQRMALGIAATILLLVGVGLLNIALFLWLRVLLGDIPAVLIVAFGHLLIGGLLLFLTVREPQSAELDALANAELAALEALTADANGIVGGLAATGGRMQMISNNLSLGIAAISGLKSLMSRPNGVVPKP